DPAKSIRQRIDFVRQLHDRDALLPRERQRRFLQQDGWVAWPGPALAELMQRIVSHNRMLAGGFVIGDRSITLADMTCPLLCFVGDSDEIANPTVVRAVRKAAPRAEIYEASLEAGHFGLVVGSGATEVTWPTVADWVHWREGGGDLPEQVHELPDFVDQEAPTPSTLETVVSSAGLAANLTFATARAMAAGASRSARALRGLAEEAVEQMPRLNRLERVRPSSRISLGQILSEQAASHPTDTLFLFEDRGHT